MTYIQKLLKHLFPNKMISYRLSDLMYNLLNQNIDDTHIYISIEKDNNSREFSYFTYDELMTLYQQCPVLERSLYEIITPANQVKAYIDFEYFIDKNLDIQNSHIGPNCLLKILSYLLNFQSQINFNTINYNDLSIQNFLVLDSSTPAKVSYHFIHGNPSVLFESNMTFGVFIKSVIHYLLWLIVEHKCSSFNINLNLRKYNITELIKVLTPYISILRTYCNECYLLSNCISVKEIAHLLVFNTTNEFTLAIDLNVYSKNQQFRFFDCVKRGRNNSLLQCTYFPFNGDCQISYFDLLRKSIVTNIKGINVPVIYQQNNQFFLKLPNTLLLSEINNDEISILTNINNHIKLFFSSNITSLSFSNSNKPNTNRLGTQIYIDQTKDQSEYFIPFVENLIKLDTLHQGYISSCVRGNKNKNLLFFNIDGNYRFCPRIGTHHERNTTAVLIDTKNHTYCIRCKDPNCNNTFLVWNSIQ